MPKYKATIKVSIVEYHKIEIEAENTEEAEEIACDWDGPFETDWSCTETFTQYCDDSLEEIKDYA